MQDFPAANDDGQRLTITNSLELLACRSEMRGVLMVAAAFPVLLTVTVLVVMLPTATAPKLMLDGDTVITGPDVAVTVSITCGAAK